MKRLLFLAAVGILLTACTTTKYVPVVSHTTDTLRLTSSIRDSIFIHDSTIVDKTGDTVKIEIFHTKYRVRTVHDTIYESHTDSVPVPYPVEVIKEVPAELTWWQMTRMHTGGVVLFVLAGCIVYGIYRFIKRI